MSGVPAFLGGVDQDEDGKWVTAFDLHENCPGGNCGCEPTMKWRGTTTYDTAEEAIGVLMDTIRDWKPPGAENEDWRLLGSASA